MDIVKLREQLTVDEGVKLVTYLDHLGLKTVAIGHLCREDDEEFDMPLGSPITEERCNELFDQDIQITINDCKKVYDDWLRSNNELHYKNISKIEMDVLRNDEVIGYSNYFFKHNGDIMIVEN